MSGPPDRSNSSATTVWPSALQRNRPVSVHYCVAIDATLKRYSVVVFRVPSDRSGPATGSCQDARFSVNGEHPWPRACRCTWQRQSKINAQVRASDCGQRTAFGCSVQLLSSSVSLTEIMQMLYVKQSTRNGVTSRIAHHSHPTFSLS